MVKKARATTATMNPENRREGPNTFQHICRQGAMESLSFTWMKQKLFPCLSCGRSKKGARCLVKTPANKLENVHIIGANPNTGLGLDGPYWERRRGSYIKEECHGLMQRMLRASGTHGANNRGGRQHALSLWLGKHWRLTNVSNNFAFRPQQCL